MTASEGSCDFVLPYRTDWREMYRVLDYCKGKGADRAALDSRFGAGESLRETLNALEQFGWIVRNEMGDVRLSDAGDRLAYAPSDDLRRQLLIEALLAYPPYRGPLERAAAAGLDVLDAPAVEHIWQVEMRLAQPRNRVEEARTFFFRFANDAGLGTYRRGVRGQTTRLELDTEALDTIRQTLSALDIRQAADDLLEPPAPDDTLAGDAVLSQTATGEPQAAGRRTQPAGISIHVDMSEWDLEKIEAFLRLIGYLDED
jgi:hypothetical protein